MTTLLSLVGTRTSRARVQSAAIAALGRLDDPVGRAGAPAALAAVHAGHEAPGPAGAARAAGPGHGAREGGGGGHGAAERAHADADRRSERPPQRRRARAAAAVFKRRRRAIAGPSCSAIWRARSSRQRRQGGRRPIRRGARRATSRARTAADRAGRATAEGLDAGRGPHAPARSQSDRRCAVPPLSVETKDGASLTGIIQSETQTSVTLRPPFGAARRCRGRRSRAFRASSSR